MPSDQQMTMFRDLMKTLMPKPKEELRAILEDPDCPTVIKNIIREHPALLGDRAVGLERNAAVLDFQRETTKLITSKGYKNISEWEYELNQTDGRATCLRIWIGKTRTKKGLRVVTLTEEEATTIRQCVDAMDVTA